MIQNINIDFDKFFAPIEDLELKKRAYRMLKRAGIRQVSDIIIAGEVKIRAIKNIGPLIGEYIISETVVFFGVSKDVLFSEDFVKLIMQEKENVTHSGYDPIELLNLSPLIINFLKQVGITRMADLIASSDIHYGNLIKIENSKFGDRVLRELDKRLLIYLTSKKGKHAENKKEITDIRDYEGKNGEVSSFTGSKKMNYLVGVSSVATKQIEKLAWIFDSMGMNDRAWLIVELKANRLLSLKKISAEIGGATRTRISQIVDWVIEKVKMNLKSFSVFFDFFEKKAIEFRSKSLNETLTLDTLVKYLNNGLMYEYLYATDEDVEKLIVLIRLLVMRKKPWFSEITETKWKNLVFLSCLVDPAIEIDSRGTITR
jgi:hypothetical protein